jgi:hypothetical protein
VRRKAPKGFMKAQKILAVAALGAALRQPAKLIERDIAKPQGDFLRAENARSLPLLQYLYEMTGLDQP